TAATMPATDAWARKRTSPPMAPPSTKAMSGANTQWTQASTASPAATRRRRISPMPVTTDDDPDRLNVQRSTFRLPGARSAARQLASPVAGGLDGLQHGRADPVPLQLPDRRDRPPPRRGDGL